MTLNELISMKLGGGKLALRPGSGAMAGDEKKCLATSAGELILMAVGEDLARPGLDRTPERFAKALREICSGYTMTLADAVGEGVFPAEGKGIVSVKDVEFYSMCEHHMLPFYGQVSVAYLPNEKILGLSKIPRVVDMYARRFQVQERLTRQVADAITEAISPRAVVVKMTGSHMCMMMRGVEKQASVTTTEFAVGVESLTETEKARLYSSLS
ncbi:MAG: GTP cyclohydrolase I FolE [Bdellovibrionales bacterium]|nr:GTP cyclohydrolase I FolE [Bdellovibrionales bacterium]